MPPSPGVRPAPREQLVLEIRGRLARLGEPRLQLLLILVLAGTAAFLASVAGLWLGVASMPLRYAIATVAGYVTFLALLRAWIAWQRGSWPDFDVGPDLLEIDLSVRDIKTSADYLVQIGFADSKRLGITGGSYGGYMTMAGLTEFPDLFAAGANLFGMVNFATFFEHTEPWMAAISTIEYGDPVREADMLASLSPIHKLDRISAATIVLHGANDTNVPVVEGEQIVENLKGRGVPVEYILFPDEGHGWRKIPNRIKSTVEVTKFFARHLK